MGRVLTNNSAFAYAEETAGSPGVLPGSPTWFLLEPNAITAFGSTITTVARRPISNDRQRRKGTPTDLDSVVEFEHDLVLDPFTDVLQRFVFARAVNIEMDINVTAVETTGDSYAVAALTAGQANKLEFAAGQYATLIKGRGFTNSANNGVKQVDADIAASATAVSVAENLVDEPSPPANARIELAGLRSLAAAADFTWAWDAGTRTATLTSAADITDFTQFGLVAGQRVHIGSRDSSDNIQNAFQNLAANDMFGFARILSFNNNVITFDQVGTALRFDDATAPATAVDLMFGKRIRNVPGTSADFLDVLIQVEALWQDLIGDVAPFNDGFEYALGNQSNTLGLQLPLTDKAIFTAGFVGTDTETPTQTRKTNAANPVLPNGTEALNTSLDIARILVQELDEDGVTTFFKSLNLNINNNASTEKVLGTLGAAFTNFGDLDVDLETQALFTSGDILAAIRNNLTVNLQFILRNTETTMYFDVPELTLEGGGRDLPRNESVLVNFSGRAYRDSVFGISLGVDIFPTRL